MNYSKEQQLKAKYEKKLKKAKQPSIAELKKIVQRLCNAYIRLRDKEESCISCLKFYAEKDAGHFVAQGSSGALRYNEDNLHGQCQSCNRFKHGNLIEYRWNLVKKIGGARVGLLEDQRHNTKKWDRTELEALKTYFKSLIDKA